MSSSALSPPAADRDSTPVILVIDDHADMLAMAQRVLTSRGYQVLTASNGAAGLNILMERKGDVSAVVLDLHMPKLGGAHFAELIRIAWPDLPVLVISAYIQSAQPVIDRLNLASLPKPFTMSAFLDAVSTLLVER